MQQAEETQRNQQASAAKPYYQIKSPFPLEQDRRYLDQSRLAIQKRRQKTHSESVRCCKYGRIQSDCNKVNRTNVPSPSRRLGDTIYTTFRGGGPHE